MGKLEKRVASRMLAVLWSEKNSRQLVLPTLEQTWIFLDSSVFELFVKKHNICFEIFIFMFIFCLL